MNLYQQLTQALFFHQIVQVTPSTAWFYVRHDNVRYRSETDALIVERLPGANQKQTTGLQYHFKFNRSKHTRQAQHDLLDSCNWSFSMLLQIADEQHALQLRYDQIQHPYATRAPYVELIKNCPRRARPLRISLKLQDVPVAFSPFSPYVLPATGISCGKTLTRNHVLQQLLSGRLVALPNHLLDTHHVLNGLTTQHLAYSLDELALLPRLLDDKTWYPTALPGGIIQLIGLTIGAELLFLRTVRLSRRKQGVAKENMRIAA